MKQKIFILLIFLGFYGCGSHHLPVDKFTYNFQFYNYENSQVDEKGVTDLENILIEFKNYPWDEQVNKMNLPDAKSNPTIGIKDHLNDYDLGITAYPDKDGKVIFVIYHSFRSDGEWKESFREGYEPKAVEQALRLFFQRKYDKLPDFLNDNSTREFGLPLF